MSAIDWSWFAVWLGCELLLVALVAAISQVFFRSSQTQRCVWQAAFTGMGLLTIVELSGVREKLPKPDWRPHHHYSLTATIQPAQAQGALKVRDAEAQIATVPEFIPRVVAWPGRVWLAGFVFLLARSFAARVWLRVRRRAASPADAESLRLMAQLQASLGLSGLHAQSWTGLRGPVAFGVLHPTIALPRDFSERFSIGERQVMLAHEMAHLAARDPFWFLVSDVVIALAWWHPIVWWARRKLHVASEVCADEASALVPGGSCALAECLVRFGRELTGAGPARSLGVGGNGLKSQLALRIARLLREPRTWRPPSAWATRLTQFSATAFAATAIFLPVQTGISGSVLALIIASPPAHAAMPTAPKAQVNTTNQISKDSNGDMAVAEVPASNTPFAYQWVFNGSNSVGISGVVLKTNRESTIKIDDSLPIKNSNSTAHQVLAKVSDARASVSQSINNGRTEPTSLAKPPRKVRLTIQTVFLTEKDSGGLGLDWLFGSAPTDKGSVETSHDWNVLQRGFISPAPVTNNRPKSVSVDILPSGKSVVLNHGQFTALIERIEAATQDDILTAPKIVTLSGRQAHVAVQDSKEIVTSVEAKAGSATESANVSYFTDNVLTGLTCDIIPKEEDNDAWRLIVIARHVTFEGYDKPVGDASVSYSGGKPMKYQLPFPHFRVLEAVAESATPVGYTMAIRGPLVTETVKIKGSFFTRAKTKTVQQRFYVFVTPTRFPDVGP